MGCANATCKTCQTCDKCQNVCDLKQNFCDRAAGDAPAVEFAVTDDDKAVAVYAYCNLHGLWKNEL